MTENEAIERIKTGICCEKGTARYCTDACMYGKEKCAYSVAIKALEEIQQYRAIEKELKERYHANVDIPLLMQHFIETIFEGEKHVGFCILTNEDRDAWDAYRALGTVEECRAAVEKQKSFKPVTKKLVCGVGRCKCGAEFLNSDTDYCGNCGQRLDWGTSDGKID